MLLIILITISDYNPHLKFLFICLSFLAFIGGLYCIISYYIIKRGKPLLVIDETGFYSRRSLRLTGKFVSWKDMKQIYCTEFTSIWEWGENIESKAIKIGAAYKYKNICYTKKNSTDSTKILSCANETAYEVVKIMRRFKQAYDERVQQGWREPMTPGFAQQHTHLKSIKTDNDLPEVSSGYGWSYGWSWRLLWEGILFMTMVFVTPASFIVFVATIFTDKFKQYNLVLLLVVSGFFFIVGIKNIIYFYVWHLKSWSSDGWQDPMIPGLAQRHTYLFGP